MADSTFTGTDAQLNINKSLTLTGGLADNCQVFTQNKTVLQSDLPGAVITIDASGGNSVSISGFDISGAQSDPFNPFTSGIAISGNGSVNIENSLIHDNKSSLGGGISATTSDVNIQNNVEIYANEASSKGGGIYCVACSLKVANTIIGKSVNGQDFGNITTNMDSQGGGVYLEDSVNAIFGKSANETEPVDLAYNISEKGAGLYLTNSSATFKHPDSKIHNNDINVVGAFEGVVANLDMNSTLNIENSVISNNSSKLENYLFTLATTSTLNISSTIDGCGSKICSIVTNNTGLLFKNNDLSTINLSRVRIKENTLRWIVFMNPGNDFTATNTLIDNNSFPAVNGPMFFNGGVNLINVTIANNISNLTEPSSAMFKLSSEKTTVKGSVIWNNDMMFIQDTGNFNNLEVSDSVIQYDPTGYPNTTQINPLFVDATNGNYHLQFISPAIDYFTGTTTEDMEGDLRPQGNDHDAGADEWTDLIFKNGFELN